MTTEKCDIYNEMLMVVTLYSVTTAFRNERCGGGEGFFHITVTRTALEEHEIATIDSANKNSLFPSSLVPK